MGDYRELRFSTDELTGLLEKQAFYDCAQDLMINRDDNKKLVFIFFDLVNFKIYNANYGFAKGDELLICIATLIKENFQGQLLSRFSGDHFMVCSNSTQIIPIVKTIREQIKSYQQNINIELKAGIYIYDGIETNVIKCCDRARMACISIKKDYDIAYRIYDEELGGILTRKQEILDTLDEALEKKYIKVYYQPIVRAYTGKVCGWEALVRWIDPVKGMVFPDEFIPVLEEYRLISKVDLYIIEEVLSKYNSEVREKNDVAPVSINLSRIDFEVMDVPAYIDEMMERYNCPKEMFHFEITESILTADHEFIMNQVRRMRNEGYAVWMDDFGSGYSSLNLLKNHQFDLVKIDMGFLSNFNASDNGKIILRHIVSMIKNLSMHTLVEGVETKEQYDFLCSIGCEMIQGYLIGRPMPFLEAIQCIKNDGREIESLSERHFYEEIGKVDILKQNPLTRNMDNDSRTVLPLAIGKVENGIWHFVYTNSGYIKVITDYGYFDIKSLEDAINKRDESRWAQCGLFWGLCEHSKKEKTSQTMDFVESGHIINLKLNHIASDDENNRDAYLISVRALSRYISEGNENRMNAIGRQLLSFYQSVDIFGVNTNYYENIYLNDSRLTINFKSDKPTEIIKEISEIKVHPDEKKAFLDYMNLGTIENRIKKEKVNSLIGFFRLLDQSNNYRWKSIVLSVASFENMVVVISCVSETAKEVEDRIERYNFIGTKGKIKNLKNCDTAINILQMLPLGVFWKDKERRFMGANQMFLDYYGFNTVESIIGKTDEDMGWHINPVPFMLDELAVINDGKVIQNVYGECIVNGQVRKISASKRPFVVDGEVKGLIGFFTDITDSTAEHERLETLSKTDPLTGLYNRRGFDEIVLKYIDQYRKDETDFAMYMIDVDKFKHINDFYGHDFGDQVLKITSNIIRKVAGDNSIVCRYGGDEFVIIHQYRNFAEIEAIKAEIGAQLSQIHKIDKTDIRINVSVGYSVYSGCKDIEKLVAEVDKRMYENKKIHKLV